MKKIITIFLILASILVFCSCSEKEPSQPITMDEKTFKLALKTIETVDRYLNFDIAADETGDILGGYLDTLDSFDYDDDTNYYLIGKNSLTAALISFRTKLRATIYSDTYDEIKEYRDKFYKDLH